MVPPSFSEPQIQAFRVFVSGAPSTFDSIDTALDFIRAEAVHNRIEHLTMESVRLDLADYNREVAQQEGKQS
jgi:hypothetical protein